MMEDLFGSSAAAVPLNDDDDDFAAATTISSCNNHHHHDNYNSVDEDLPRFQDCYSHGSSNAKTTTAGGGSDHPLQCNPMLQFKKKPIKGSANGDSDICDHHHHDDDHSNEFLIIKTQITNHPRFLNLVSAHIECQKVGAPPKMAALLEEIGFESNFTKTSPYSCSSDIGADPELDEFMESYCEVLNRYKEELSRPYDEATSFFSSMQSQLSDICKGGFSTVLNDYFSDKKSGTSEEESSCCGQEAGPPESQDSFTLSSGAGDGEGDVKEQLMRKYRGCLSSLKKEFLKKRKKGKLPIDAKPTLMHWWHQHHTWPYPTEDEKMKLSEETGLEQKQISNWFINQRKRHWKPCEDMRLALLGLEERNP